MDIKSISNDSSISIKIKKVKMCENINESDDEVDDSDQESKVGAVNGIDIQNGNNMIDLNTSLCQEIEVQKSMAECSLNLIASIPQEDYDLMYPKVEHHHHGNDNPFNEYNNSS